MASASYDQTVRLWDVAAGQEIKQLRGHKEVVWGVAFSPDGSLVALGSADRTVRLWETATEVDFRRGQKDRTIRGRLRDPFADDRVRRILG